MRYTAEMAPDQVDDAASFQKQSKTASIATTRQRFSSVRRSQWHFIGGNE